MQRNPQHLPRNNIPEGSLSVLKALCSLCFVISVNEMPNYHLGFSLWSQCSLKPPEFSRSEGNLKLGCLTTQHPSPVLLFS